MKYAEIVGLYESFHPVYDLESEHDSRYWRQFVSNRKFEEILSTVLASFEGVGKDRKSIWIQGAYGTGKSHATAVIKHLLWDELHDDIQEFIIGTLRSSQIRQKLVHFRKSGNRVFPVVIKGTSGIDSPQTFRFVIQKAVKRAIRQLGHTPEIYSGFQKVIRQLEAGVINLEKLVQETDLQIYGSSQEIIKKLKNEDVEVLKKVEHVLEDMGLQITYDDITDWLLEVVNQLRSNGIAKYLMIYWDEFTGVLDLPTSRSLLTDIQSIAELSEDQGVYLFIVSHRKLEQFQGLRDDIGKVRDRFKVIEYSMEPTTTYHIVRGVLKKKNLEDYQKVRAQFLDASIEEVIRNIAEREQNSSTGAVAIKLALEDIFPIHAYTIYVATLLARYFG
ncbi:MAG: hypothetical protein H5T94_11340, partial [Pseudothermotoga sp.]|nr:hypothetical protein [Pseudothermotoga sp.]